MRMMSIASSSKGNCIYIGSDNTHILVDCGISRKKVVEGLTRLDLSLEDIDAILITHEHDDHIKGLGVLERTRRIPIISSMGTCRSLIGRKMLGNADYDVIKGFEAGADFSIGDIEIKTVSISHDAADPVGYTFSQGSAKAGILTDLGKYSDEIIEKYSNLSALLLESNHDVRMLQVGPYPYSLKQRIYGDKGHLSNEASGKLLTKLLNDRIQKIMLGHLSEINNYPEIAFQTVCNEVDLSDNCYKSKDFDISVLNREDYSEIIELRGEII